MSLIFITGGTRSGKSKYAEALASKKGENTLYIATGVNTDSQMETKIKLHQERRPVYWGLVEEPLWISTTIDSYKGYDVIPLDSLTTLVSNHLIVDSDLGFGKMEKKSAAILGEVETWLSKIHKTNVTYIVVSDETGLGGIAMSSLGRWFQEVLGDVNQMIAKQADEGYFVISGLTMRLK